MATLLLQAAGTAIGGVFGPLGAMVGRAAGALAGSAIDRALIAGSSTVSGARLSTARIPGADEGTPITRLYGTMRIGGTLIWATRFEEEVTSERSGGKAGGTRVRTFRYFANFAVGLCEGPVASIRRVWADGREIDLTGIEMRLHRGDEDQLPDPLIAAKQGEGNAPAYRGLAYVVFERLPLDTFGNRIPVLQFEVLRPVGRLERQIRAVTIIPGATEHGYATVQVSEKTGEGSGRILNRNTLSAATDWQASLDELQALCPHLERVALVVSWFGTDLRAGECRILPGVEVAARREESAPWSVAGMSRDDAHPVSLRDGGPAYGGTPDDGSVLQAIADLRRRGLKVYLYPFLMMDVPPGNGLPDPHGGGEQAAYPWRGRISCYPGPAAANTADGSAQAALQVERFSRGAEGYRRMALHYAALARQAGGVDGFILGSELRGLTRLRDASGGFPFVTELVTLAADIRAVLGQAAKLTYGADWSEYFGYHPQDGSGDVFFHLDPLWASPDIDAVGIDNYMPLSDWRDGDLASGNPDGFRAADDASAMLSQIAAGEGYDWYYAGEDARKARLRAPITDGLAGKPWTFRYKDIHGWWSSPHHDRVNGAERADPSPWRAGMKPVWFTELGCPAVDKGANQPNVFVDPKSAESELPYFSSGARSDSQQRRFLEAHHQWWQGQSAPQGMVDPDHVFVWTWDARPQPAFPDDLSIWSDGDNWRTGHWLNGRLGATTLADAIAAILTDHGFADFDVSRVSGDLTGYVQADLTSARALIEPLCDAFQIDVTETAGVLRFRSRLQTGLPPGELAVLADIEDEALFQETRADDGDLAAEVVMTFADPALDYEQASMRSRRSPGSRLRLKGLTLSAALAKEAALSAAESLLRAQSIGQRRLSFSLSPAQHAFEPGDAIRLAGIDALAEDVFLIDRIEDGAVRRISATRHLPLPPVLAGVPSSAQTQRRTGTTASAAFAPLVHFLDLPRYDDGAMTSFARAAAHARPWHRLVLSSSVGTEGYVDRVTLERPARIGALTAPLAPGVSGRFDNASALELDLFFGGLSSVAMAAMLNGENRLAVRAGNGIWEVIDFMQAEEVSAGRWRLSHLLRGLCGTEDAMAAGAPAGAACVILDAGVVPLDLATGERGRSLNWLVEPAGSAARAIGPLSFAGGLRAETPLAPVHLSARRLSGGDIALDWVRRSRLDADDWEPVDVPLDEASERYRLDILDGPSPRRTVEVDAPSFLYAAAAEIADFGSRQSRITVQVRQIGRIVPLGIAALASIDL